MGRSKACGAVVRDHLNTTLHLPEEHRGELSMLWEQASLSHRFIASLMSVVIVIIGMFAAIQTVRF